MPDNQNAQLVKMTANGIAMEVDLAQVLTAIDPSGRYLGYDPDADEDRYTHSSLQQELVHATSLELVKQLRKEVTDQVRTSVSAAIESEVAAIVRETLVHPVQRTNEWGSKVGDARPLSELIAQQAQDALMKPTGDSYGRRPTVVQRIIADEVVKQFKTELQAHVKEAKEDAAKAVKESAAEVIAETIQRASRGL